MKITQTAELTISHMEIGAIIRKVLEWAGDTRPEKDTLLNYGEHFVTPCRASEVLLQNVFA
jgi:hypothetical protein